LKLRFSCLSLPSARITALCHHARPRATKQNEEASKNTNFSKYSVICTVFNQIFILIYMFKAGNMEILIITKETLLDYV
jgi:hypothetical protein